LEQIGFIATRFPPVNDGIAVLMRKSKSVHARSAGSFMQAV
jgi:hypothetical protein